MATRTFLTEDQFKQARNELKAFSGPVHMENLFDFPGHPHSFSHFLGQSLESRLSAVKGWKRAHPIALGSWARNELCPKSDIDLLFVGDETAVAEVVKGLQESGVRIRSRMPEDPSDWTVGVDPFDILALLYAKPFTGEGAEKLSAQQSRIRSQRGLARKLLTAMVAERRARAERYDSISNFLEPNIKYGQGGLRDLQQALFVFDLFRHKFPEECRAQRILEYYRDFFLAIRQNLHMQNLGDIMVATEQVELAQWCAFDDIKSFMREVSIGLKRVSFYADWIVEQARSSHRRIQEVQKKKVPNKMAALKAVQKDPNILMQEQVRAKVPLLFSKYSKSEKKQLGQYLHKMFSRSLNEKLITALFRSRFIEFCIREIDPLIGLVQHDQYHRYSADAHILQALKETVRIRRKPTLLGKIKSEVRSLKEVDWKILLWTCIYHDIAKGRPGDHSVVGAKIVEKDFKELGLSAGLRKEVKWMVESHLLLSDAAFRKNPQSPATWRELGENGVKGARLRRLAVFTAIDIRATNPEAWNSWKERLLFDLVKVLRSPKAGRFMKLLEEAKTQKIKLAPEFVQALDPELVAMVPRKYLLSDFRDLKRTKGDLPVLILPKRGEETWVRFHRRKDRSGLFLELVNTLHSAGCRVDEAAIQTFRTLGVYDWFKVRSTRTPAQLRKLFGIIPEKQPEIPPVKFDRILLVGEDEEEAIISFRGRDQKGALVAAAHRLFQAGFQIRWARVHTWGRQIDDVFGVEKLENLEDAVKKLITDSVRPIL